MSSSGHQWDSQQRRRISGPRPHLWRHGTDPVIHRLHRRYQLHRVQARYRQEAHELTFEQYRDFMLIDDRHLRAGRTSSYCMARRNPQLPWRADNIIWRRKDWLKIR